MASPTRALSGTLGRRLCGGHRLVAARSGAGMPVGTLPPPSTPLREDDELVWDDGSAHPEPCIDNVAPHISKYDGLLMLLGGLSLFGGIAFLARLNNKAARVPYAPREYPYDNLRVERGGEP